MTEVQASFLGLVTLEPGQRWAYRRLRSDPLVEVTVLKVGNRKPARVQVELLADEFEGSQRWIPPSRLKCPWVQSEEFSARERQWESVQAQGPARDDPRQGAAEVVFRELVPTDVAIFAYASHGVVRVFDVGALAKLVGLAPADLTTHVAAFIEDGQLIGPWPLTELIAQAAVRADPERRMFTWAAATELKASLESVHGRRVAGRAPFYVEPAACLADDQQYGQPVRAVLKRWCAS